MNRRTFATAIATVAVLTTVSAIAYNAIQGDDESADSASVALAPPGCTTIGTYAGAEIVACPTTTTTGAPTSTSQSTTTASSAPTTTATSAPTTTAAPTTTQAPTTTAAPTTTQAPTTTAAPTTTTSTTTPPTTTTAPPSGSGFSETFDTAASLDRFDWQVRSYTARDVADDQTTPGTTFRGEHAVSCGAPTEYRTINGGYAGFPSPLNARDTGSVYWCNPGAPTDPANGHVMTALDTSGVMLLSFSPKGTFTNVKRICWNQNMNDLGQGKWLNVYAVDATAYVFGGANLGYTSSSAAGIGDPSAHRILPAGSLDFTWFRGAQFYGNSSGNQVEMFSSQWRDPYNLSVSSGPRYKICLGQHPTQPAVAEQRHPTTNVILQRARPAIPAFTGLLIQRPLDQQCSTCTPGTFVEGIPFPVTFPANSKIIFQDATYDNTKHGGSPDHVTWHWDNLVIETQ